MFVTGSTAALGTQKTRCSIWSMPSPAKQEPQRQRRRTDHGVAHEERTAVEAVGVGGFRGRRREQPVIVATTGGVHFRGLLVCREQLTP